MGGEFTIEDILIIMRRRILYFLIPVVVLVPAGLLVIFALPSNYAAQGTILVESQQIPEELIRSTINSYAQERIRVIQQRVMTRDRLLRVADEYDLFEGRRPLSSSEKVRRMRKALNVKLISANMERRGRIQEGAIAFTVGYTDRSAQKAYLVANEFMTLFLTEDVRSRKDGASDTTQFFDQEAKRLRTAVDGLETRIARFKEENADALPEHLDVNMQRLDRATGDLADKQNQIMFLEEERTSIEGQLANYLAGSASSDGPAQEITRLKAALASLRAEKTDSHPDVRALRDQISSLQRQLEPSAAIQELRKALEAKENALREARNAAEPDAAAVAVLRGDVEDARNALSSQLLNEASNGSPDFIAAQIQGRLEVANSRLSSLNRDIDDLQTQIADFQERIERTPAVARGLAVLTRDQENLSAQYQQIQAKRQQAITAENLEDNQQAEKFSILEPAVRPDKPSSPDRAKLAVLVVFAAFGVGGAVALGMEFLMASVRGRDHLASLLDEQPLAVIPYIEATGERRLRLPFFGPKSPVTGHAAA